MATNTYVALDETTVGTAVPSVTFTGISGAYTDLVIVAAPVMGTDAQNLKLQFNGDTTTNYSATFLEGDGSSASSGRNSTTSSINTGNSIALGNTQNTVIWNVQNYANTTTFKTVLIRMNSHSASYAGTGAIVGLWRKTPEAITSLTLTAASGNIAVGSTFSLYGIAAEGQGYATGGYVTSDSQYYYHTFAASGTFTPTQSITADCLVIGGGGGAGSGGGGAGGALAFASQSLTATGYTVTVGAGGAGGNGGSPSNNGTNGVDSQFAALTLVEGGGGGGGTEQTAGSDGGSGGGGGASGVTTRTGGTGSQGGNGGSNGGFIASIYPAGGGGGKGGNGGNATSASAPGTGGIGVSTITNWGSLSDMFSATGLGVGGTIAGGGGGGAYAIGGTTSTASGGGGAGGNGVVGTNGTANTGGGAGGGNAAVEASGGSGVIVVRYLKA